MQKAPHVIVAAFDYGNTHQKARQQQNIRIALTCLFPPCGCCSLILSICVAVALDGRFFAPFFAVDFFVFLAAAILCKHLVRRS